jgi:uncharacterized protein
MRFGGRGTSDNVESQRGQSFGGSGGLGGGAGMLFGLVASRFGIGGIIVLVLIMWLFGGLGNLTGGGQQAVSPSMPGQAGSSAAEVCASDPVTRFSCQVLRSTEEQWGRLFQAQGASYRAPKMVIYAGGGRSGCGAADSAMGPFYCSLDQGIYLDTAFFEELGRRYAAPGDFAQAYVIAHEVGHHVQHQLGITEQVERARSTGNQARANEMSVRLELQADCFAGVWGHHAQNQRQILEQGDVEEAMNAASKIGDDALQQASGRAVVPESFTHGSSAQRQRWFKTGLSTGSVKACDTFSARSL